MPVQTMRRGVLDWHPECCRGFTENSNMACGQMVYSVGTGMAGTTNVVGSKLTLKSLMLSLCVIFTAYIPL